MATSLLAVFQTVDQPSVVSGNFTAAGLLYLLTLTAIGLGYLQHKKGNSLAGVDKDESLSDEPSLTSLDGSGLGKGTSGWVLQVKLFKVRNLFGE